MLVQFQNDWFDARKLTVESLDWVAQWLSGSVRGTKLPPEQRFVQYWEREHEKEIQVGQWVVLLHNTGKLRVTVVLNEDEFNEVFMHG